MGKSYFGVYALAAFLFLFSAQAAQQLTVKVDSASVYQQPNTASGTVDAITGGTVVSASSNPTNGFFKVRSPKGIVGWVSAEDLGQEAPDRVGGSGSENTSFRTEASRFKKQVGRLSLHGGLDFFSFSQSTALSDQGYTVSMGPAIGGDFLITAASPFVIGVYADYIFKNLLIDITGSSGTTSVSIDTSFHVIPLELLIGAEFPSHGIFRIFFAGFGGYALAGLSATATVGTASTATTASGGGPTFGGQLRLGIYPHKNFGFFVDGGYRYAKTTLTVDGSTTEIPLDFSGAYASGGISLCF